MVYRIGQCFYIILFVGVDWESVIGSIWAFEHNWAPILEVFGSFEGSELDWGPIRRRFLPKHMIEFLGRLKVQSAIERRISYKFPAKTHGGGWVVHSSELNWAPKLMWFLPKHVVEVWVVWDFGAQLNAEPYEFSARTHGGGLGCLSSKSYVVSAKTHDGILSRFRIRSSIKRQIWYKFFAVVDYRICQQQHTEEPLIDLGCSCRGELAKAHRSCIDMWFKNKGSNKCEVCQ